MDVHSELRTVPKVVAAVTLSAFYARYISCRFRLGLPRLTCLLPVLVLFPFLPMLFTSIHFRSVTGFLVSWLCLFKLLLLCFNRGPLDTSLSVISFISLATLPVKLPTPIDSTKQSSIHSMSPKYLLSTAIKAVLLSGVYPLHRFNNQMHPYLYTVVLCFHTYLFLEVILATAAILTGAILGMELEPQFNKPYISCSLRDFWGRRWNMMVSAILRPSVYNPVQSYLGRPAAVIATFIVSGMMHELMLYYLTLLPPDGKVLAFFVLHGVCMALEAWWAQHVRWWRPPGILTTVGTILFMACTSIWLFFPAMLRGDHQENARREIEAVMGLLIST